MLIANGARAEMGPAPTVSAATPAASPSQSNVRSVLSDTTNAIAGNPGAVNTKPGIGLLGQLLGFGPDSGVFLGGVWVGNGDYLIGGGVNPDPGISTAWRSRRRP